MSRARAAIAIVGATALIALVLIVVAASGGDDGGATTTSAAPAQAPSAPPSGDLGALPPGFVECMAEQGYELQSSADIHSAPRRYSRSASEPLTSPYQDKVNRMAVPIAVIIRFGGDPDDLLERFERARRLWMESQDPGFERPVFHAACRTEDGIAIVTVWETAVGHRAFGQGLHSVLDATGLPAPERIERMRIERLGWD